jgi:hypothetical protein
MGTLVMKTDEEGHDDKDDAVAGVTGQTEGGLARLPCGRVPGQVGAGGRHQGFPAAVEAFHDLCTGRYYGEAVAVQPGQAGHEEADRPDRPPVEQHGMSDDSDLTRGCPDGRFLFLDRGHGSSFPARVVVASHTVSRAISRNRRQAALLVGRELTGAGESPAPFSGQV